MVVRKLKSSLTTVANQNMRNPNHHDPCDQDPGKFQISPCLLETNSMVTWYILQGKNEKIWLKKEGNEAWGDSVRKPPHRARIIIATV